MGSALRIAIGGSAAMHAGLLLALTWRQPAAPPTTAPTTPAPPNADEPVAISLVTLPGPEPGDAVPSATRRPSVASDPADTRAPGSSMAPSTGALASSTATDTRPGSGRGEPDADPAGVGSAKGRGDGNRRRTAAEPDKDAGLSAHELARRATVALIPSRPPANDPLAMSRPAPIPRPGSLSRRPVEGHRPAPLMRDRAGGGKHAGDGLVGATVEEDGQVSALESPPPIQGAGLGFTFDLTDALMAQLGEETYAARKRKLLDATREQRAEMASGARSRRLRASLRSTRRALQRLWTRRDLSAARKRALIFELWDECAERGSREVVATGRSVRATIESFVARRLPAGGPHAYSKTELDELNDRRSSTSEFRPYR